MQILPSLKSGGVERGTVDLAKILKLEDFEPIVVSNGGVMTYQLSEKSIKHFSLPVHSKSPFTIISNIKKLPVSFLVKFQKNNQNIDKEF